MKKYVPLFEEYCHMNESSTARRFEAGRNAWIKSGKNYRDADEYRNKVNGNILSGDYDSDTLATEIETLGDKTRGAQDYKNRHSNVLGAYQNHNYNLLYSDERYKVLSSGNFHELNYRVIDMDDTVDDAEFYHRNEYYISVKYDERTERWDMRFSFARSRDYEKNDGSYGCFGDYVKSEAVAQAIADDINSFADLEYVNGCPKVDAGQVLACDTPDY